MDDMLTIPRNEEAIAGSLGGLRITVQLGSAPTLSSAVTVTQPCLEVPTAMRLGGRLQIQSSNPTRLPAYQLARFAEKHLSHGPMYQASVDLEQHASRIKTWVLRYGTRSPTAHHQARYIPPVLKQISTWYCTVCWSACRAIIRHSSSAWCCYCIHTRTWCAHFIQHYRCTVLSTARIRRT